MKKLKTIVALMLVVTMVAVFPVTSFGKVRSGDDTVVKGDFYAKGGSFGNSEEAVKMLDVETGESPYFDYRWLTTFCNDKYNRQLAEMANLIATDTYSGTYVSFNTEEGDGNDRTQVIKALGFENTSYRDLSGYSADADDTTGIAMGHRVIEINGAKFNVFVASVAGTREDGDWLSNFDLGADTDDYYDATGQHPEWKNKAHHKGFDIAANRAKPYIDSYIESNSEEGAINALLLTGHSRGAGIANILGTYYEKDSDINSYTYTFACPGTVCVKNTGITEKQAKSYKTIFNIINEDDFISIMPMPSIGFMRYGTDKSAMVSNEDDLAALYKQYTGNKYKGNGADRMAMLERYFTDLAKYANSEKADRGGFYAHRITDEDDRASVIYYEDFDDDWEKYTKAIDIYGLENYVNPLKYTVVACFVNTDENKYKIYDVQILGEGEKAYAPKDPAMEGKVFKGWKDEETEEMFTFDSDGVETDKYIRLYSVFEDSVESAAAASGGQGHDPYVPHCYSNSNYHGYYIGADYSNAFMLRSLAGIMANRDDPDMMNKYFSPLSSLCMITGDEPGNALLLIALLAMAGCLAPPHETVSSYIIAENTADEATEHSGGEAGCISGALCSSCGCEYTAMDKTNHIHKVKFDAVQPTYAKEGHQGGVRCRDCGEIISGGEKIPVLDKKDLSSCGVELKYTTTKFSGKRKTPKVRVFDRERTLSADWYTVKYTSNLHVGTAAVTITAKDGDVPYKGVKKTTFKIKRNSNMIKGVPVKIKSVGKKKITVSLTKVKRGQKYQIWYRPFKVLKWKTVTVTLVEGKALTKTIGELTSGKKYYVKARAFSNDTGWGDFDKLVLSKKVK